MTLDKYWKDVNDGKVIRTKKPSLRKSINNFCQECMGGNKNMVGSCTAKTCPLYNVRPNWGRRNET